METLKCPEKSKKNKSSLGYFMVRNVQKQSPEVFYKKGALKNFTKFHRKAPVPEPLFK